MPRAKKVETKTLGAVVDRLVSIKEEKAAMALREKDLNTEKENLEKDLLAMMVEQGTAEVTVHGKRVGFTIKPVPQIVNGAELWKFVKAHDRYDLYYARLKTAEYEELYHLNKDVPLPGTKVVEKTEISIRTVSKI